MATIPSVPAVTRGDLTTAYQTIYTVDTSKERVIIDAVVFNNYSANTADFSVRLVQSGTGDNLNEIITEKDIRAGFNDLAPSMIGQALNAGAEIQVKSSSNSAINMTMTVTEIVS